jgi:hypothetical protein
LSTSPLTSNCSAAQPLSRGTGWRRVGRGTTAEQAHSGENHATLPQHSLHPQDYAFARVPESGLLSTAPSGRSDWMALAPRAALVHTARDNSARTEEGAAPCELILASAYALPHCSSPASTHELETGRKFTRDRDAENVQNYVFLARRASAAIGQSDSQNGSQIRNGALAAIDGSVSQLVDPAGDNQFSTERWGAQEYTSS